MSPNRIEISFLDQKMWKYSYEIDYPKINDKNLIS